MIPELGTLVLNYFLKGDTGEDGMRLLLGDTTGWLYTVDAVDPICERHYYLGTPVSQ